MVQKMDHAENLDRIEEFLRKKLEESGADGFVLGLSGGMDSATAAKTVVETLGPEKLVGWMMPGEPSSEENMEDARQLAEKLGIELQEVDISPVVEKFSEKAPFEPDKLTEGNVRARARMVFQYIEANQNNLLVLGAGNRSEAILGYFTKYGDGAVDVMPFGDLYKTELREFAEHIDLDSRFIEKEPTAGLWEGQTDVEEIGLSYDRADPILKMLVEENMEVEEIVEAADYSRKEVRRVKELYESSHHKRSIPPYPSLR